MQKPKYCQCKLKRLNTEQVAFIPEEFAKIGKYVQIREDGVWVNGWLVESAGEPTENPPDWRKSIRGHRDNTGDSLPKRSVDEN